MFDTQQKSHEKKSLDVETIHYRYLGGIRLIHSFLFQGEQRPMKKKQKLKTNMVCPQGRARLLKQDTKRAINKNGGDSKRVKSFETTYNVSPQAEYNSDSQRNIKLQRT